MTDADVVIYAAANPQQAHLLKIALEERGIVAEVINDALQGAIGSLPYGLDTAPRVVVREADAQQARRLALEFDLDIRTRLASSSGRRSWFQFSIYALLVLTTSIAIYIGVYRLLPGPVRPFLPTAAMWTFLLIAMWRAFRRRRIEQSQYDDGDDE